MNDDLNMKFFTELESESPPNVLYHYTTQEGLLGILDSREIWLTHTQYLNDRREYLHAIDLVRKRLKMLQQSAGQDVATSEALVAMTDGLNGVEGHCVCVFSLSKNQDSLSQWRAYGGKNSGFSIGFSKETLFDVCKRKSLHLAKCIYELEKQEQLVAKVVDEVLRKAIASRLPGVVNWRSEVSKLMTESMNQYAPLLKHESFSDEGEWRLISGPILPIAADFRFRAGVSTIVPYYGVSLDQSKQQKFSPVRVVVGPTPHPDEAAHAVRLFLVRSHMEKCALDKDGVIDSIVPYRSW